jgi:hypothetical protein
MCAWPALPCHVVLEESRAKATYERPDLVVVDLKAEEVLATGCKMVGQAAPYNPISCMANSCAGPGS